MVIMVIRTYKFSTLEDALGQGLFNPYILKLNDITYDIVSNCFLIGNNKETKTTLIKLLPSRTKLEGIDFVDFINIVTAIVTGSKISEDWIADYLSTGYHSKKAFQIITISKEKWI